MKIGEDDFIVDMAVIKPNSQIVTISSKGYGKRSDVDEYRLQTRGGMGVKAGVFNEKTGDLVALKQTYEDNDILLIADNGVIIRTPLDQISKLSRVSQGVKVMRLKDDNFIVGVALVKKEDEENTAEGENILTEQDNSAIISTQENA